MEKSLSSLPFSTEVAEILFMVIIIVVLLTFINFLSKIGLLDPVPVKQSDLPTILIATSLAYNVRPETSSLMAEIAAQVAKRGVEDESSAQIEYPARGQLIAVFPGRPSVDMCPAVSHHGVVLDVGEQRVTEQSRLSWATRLSSDTSIRVSILSPVHVTYIETVERIGNIPARVARWRILRRLARRLHDGDTASSLILLVSPRRRSVMFASAQALRSMTGNLRPLARNEPTEARDDTIRRRNRQPT